MHYHQLVTVAAHIDLNLDQQPLDPEGSGSLLSRAQQAHTHIFFSLWVNI